jgi:hypothetical protein
MSPKLMWLIQFQSHLVLPNLPDGTSKIELKSSGDKTFCYRAFWIGKLSEKCSPTQILLLVSFKEILISLTSFMHTPNFMKYCAGKILPSLLNHRLPWSSWVADVLSHCTPIFSPVSNECKISNQYLISLCQNPYWWSPIISSTYGLNLESRIFDKMLCDVDSIDFPR